MKDISMHIIDIAQNSIRAKASRILIYVQESSSDNYIAFEVIDDGCGIDEQLLDTIADPYTTTRKTRNKGFGLAFLKHNAEQCGGSFCIISKTGEGTKVKAVFKTNNIDCPPLGDISGSIVLLLSANESIKWKFRYVKDGDDYLLDSEEIDRSLGGISLNNAEIINFLKSMIEENINSLNL